jgi:formylglycine-generating enzyme
LKAEQAVSISANTKFQIDHVPDLVLIPSGWFWMGSEAGQDNERPVHRVWVDEFYLATRQVTNREYWLFTQATGMEAPAFSQDPHFSHPDQPVVGVSWFEAVNYCKWLNGRTGGKYRLPTEAEWERAARGGRDNNLYPWGDESPQSRTRYHERWLGGPEPVAQCPPNAFGLFDICENVHEWCSDWYQADYYANSPENNPQGPDNGERRASRGGSWRHHVKIARCAARSSLPPQFKYADYGFRIAAQGG